MVTRTRNLDGLPRCLLVFLGRADALHGKTARLPIRMGTPRPRPHRPRLRRGNAQAFGAVRCANEERINALARFCSAGVSPALLDCSEGWKKCRRYAGATKPPAPLRCTWTPGRSAP